MDTNDDFMSFSPPKEPSPQVNHRRLKRLKKSNAKPPRSPLSDPIDDPLLFPSVDFARLEALENGSETLDFDDSNFSEDPVFSSQESLPQGVDNVFENEEGDVGLSLDEEVKKTKRVLEFDDAPSNGVGEENVDLECEHVENDKSREDDLIEKKEDGKKKKKRTKSATSGGLKIEETKANGSNKRREEKERKAYLKELHAESQRLLRETSNASFKPIPVVQKPISSVLEKIRKRKLEISKKAIIGNKRSYGYEENNGIRDNMDLDVSDEERREATLPKTVKEEIVAPCRDGENILDALNVDGLKNAVKQNLENDRDQVSLDEVPTPAFRAPVNDTQDLFDDSEPNGASAEQQNEQLQSPLEEEFVPSLPAMNLTFDSAPLDDSSSDYEEDNDKENVNPRPRGIADVSSSLQGDPVKGFVDDEAEEEADSDNDLIYFKENEEDEDVEDYEELNDMIATGYDEKPVDNERRNELHQQWLEQQDAAGTDNLLQKLKCGSELRDTFLVDEEPESDEDVEEFDDEAKEDSVPRTSAKVTMKKAKQIILQLFSDKEDVYVSDDEEDTHRRHAQQSLLIRKEERATLASPGDDESSREVFGLIKNLNIVSNNKKQSKVSSFFDTVLKGGNNNGSSKSSFVGRVSNNPIPSSNRQGSGTFRSFIFGRDDSNSRSSISMSEDSSDTVSQEIRPTRIFAAKYSNSQTKFSGQNREASEETASRTSLLDILKQQPPQPQVSHQQNTVDLTNSIFAFRAPKKPVKIEGRS